MVYKHLSHCAFLGNFKHALLNNGVIPVKVAQTDQNQHTVSCWGQSTQPSHSKGDGVKPGLILTLATFTRGLVRPCQQVYLYIKQNCPNFTF